MIFPIVDIDWVNADIVGFVQRLVALVETLGSDPIDLVAGNYWRSMRSLVSSVPSPWSLCLAHFPNLVTCDSVVTRQLSVDAFIGRDPVIDLGNGEHWLLHLPLPNLAMESGRRTPRRL